ncbi:hypothetical protein IFM89_037900 [Coptis chinensis]|uniref:Protein kinase domain-containing protein n=1 Tax=Coptis chinensis TaxID=261450 RepID=A0A835I090_9MAGN|nr:hypothetical protein IFM89_037900 [Coptis chinensis]
MGYIYEKSFPVNAKDYEVYEEVGEGVSATVYRALCIPLNVPVAVKVLDLEKCSNDSLLASIRREVHTMSSLDHPNVLRAYCSFTNDHKLWVVMPYMNGGSCLHIMKSTHPEGFEESVIATLLYEVLKALAYLHAHGYIHRDVKAGNILIDSNGVVKLADFGVSACMFDTGDRQRSRNTFVGTPCWMAPEVMQQLHGYDFKADIWSFGITALELARGHAPFSKYPPMKVLLMTLQNAPPGLDYKRDNRFSKHFKDMVAACLVKDPKKRPSSEKLLKNRFFQKARSNEFIAKTLLQGLSPLGDRLKTLKAKESELLVQNKAINGDKEKLSQNFHGSWAEDIVDLQQEYIRGISGWNFNLEDYKNDTSLDYDGDEEKPSFERVSSTLSLRQEIKLNDFQNAESLSSPLSVSPTEELHADDTNVRSPKRTDIIQSESKPPFQLQLSPKLVDEATNKTCDENSYRSCSTPHNVDSGDNDKTVTSLPPENIISPSRKINGNEDRHITSAA